MTLAVEPVSPCFPVRQEPPSYSVAQPCRGKEIARERRLIRKKAFLPFTPPFLISGPDDSLLLLVERHVCPPLPTAEICL